MSFDKPPLTIRSAYRRGIALFAVVAFTLAFADPKSNDIEHVIDLKAIGYPEPPCDFLFQVDHYGKNHVEFLDSQRLLVSFPAETSGCDKKRGYPVRSAERFRSAVMDLSGKVLHLLEWKSGDDVQAGPDGHILMLTGKEIHILDSDFSFLQTIPEARPPSTSELKLSPSRHGFAIHYHYPTDRVEYFEGNPAVKTQEADDCDRAVVVASGFLCMDANQPGGFTPHVSTAASDLKQPLADLAESGIPDNLPEKRWLSPGLAWISREASSASASAQRVMYFTTGCRFPITDSSGLGYFLRVVILQFPDKRILFRKQYSISSDVALSPDGQWLAVREGARLTLHKLEGG